MHSEFGIRWTPEEEAKIIECRSWAAARRVLGYKNNGDVKTKAAKTQLAEMAKEIYREITRAT